MFKKALALVLTLLMVASVMVFTTSCGSAVDSSFKIGFIFLHDQNST